MASDPLVGKVLKENFEILERIGEGGTGVVYRAKQLDLDRIVAIKVLGAHVSTDPSWVKRFQNEARAAAKLSHPHTVATIAFGQTKEGLLFIAMELLQGRDVRNEIDKLGRLPLDRALRICAQGSSSVHEAHVHGIIHRDIKPDNLFLCTNMGSGDFVKVLDFSVAKLDDPNSQATRAGIVFGTPCYMSPEQGRGGQLGPGSDIYAFGICLYEMIRGKPPFDSKVPTEVVMMHIRDKPAPLTEAPELVQRIVMKALDKDPAKRQRSAEELAQECENALQDLYPGGGRGSTGQHAPVAPSVSGTGVTQAASRGGAMGQGQAPPSAGSGGGGYSAPQGSPGGYGAPPAGRPNVVAQSGSTMIADDVQVSPAIQAARQAAAAGGGAPQRRPPGAGATMALDAAGGPMPSASAVAGGTMMLPDSAGVIAFAAAQADAARQSAAAERVAPPKPAGPMFWAAWVVLGIGVGLAAHFWVVHNQLQQIAAATGHT